MKTTSAFNQLTILILLVLGLACSSQSKKDAADFFLKGNQALKQKNYAEALRFYDEAIAKNADFSDAYLNKGICLLKLDQAEDAYEILSQAIKIDPSLAQANLVRAEAALSLSKLNEAKVDLDLIQKRYTDSTYFHLLQGNLYVAKGSPDQAVAAFDQALTLDKGNIEAYVNRGAVYYSLSSFPAAKIDFLNALQLDPNQPQALNNLGLIYLRERNWKEALDHFDKVLNLDPSDAFALNNKGYALLQTGSSEKAKELIERSLEKRPENGYALRNLGIYYQQKGQLELAINMFIKAIDIAEPVEMLYGLAGQAYFQQKKLAEACKIWKQGIILKDSVSMASAAKYCH
ncbi:tetratricopeptide repeat protein [Dyadobacter arcticus]|uniref:Tetratricopeptide (TPR) repeat protein n=1 Tax=Dyadobacter arcticus TaxID=1078754 RepID=A0ABX0UT23_9BACT|nr:tetratricopeptide repeat protein [Dyadobacter arcticus]NIJ54126.1 tetratricopeptide (TPR) repeat protein [Dyadobacter arcticus]